MDTPLTSAAPAELVSIVMPAYNAEQYIAASIESILAQTHTAWELWIVDDGSTDATRQVVEAYCQRDSRIHYLYQQNARQGAARNNAIAHATGQLLAFLDSDDLWLPHKLATQLVQLHSSGADLVFADAYVFYDSYEPGTDYKVLGAVPGIFTGQVGLEACLRSNPIPILTVLATKAAISRAGDFSENPKIQNAEDYHLWLRLLLTGSTLIGYPVILAAYRESYASVSGSDRINTQQVIEAKAELAQLFPASNPLIERSLEESIRENMYKFASYNSEAFFATVSRCLAITHRKNWKPLFTLYHTFSLQKLALRSFYFIFNYF